MIILVLNCGSSSLKYQVLDMKSESDYSLLAKGLVERIGLDEGVITHQVIGEEKHKVGTPIPNHTEGIKCVLDLLVDSDNGVLKSLSEIEAVGHRVAHGGDLFNSSKIIHSEVIEGIEQCCKLAPLHNPANLLGIMAIRSLMPEVVQVATFDTSFHQTMPEHAYMYAIPYEYYVKDKVRRYGFHGTSHKFVAEKAAKLAGLDINNSKIVTCHLGNGSSITAIKNGESVDTSMGFTPAEGILMGTRCGNVDAGVLTYLQSKYGLDAKGLNDLINKESGFLGISGLSSDARDVENAAEEGHHRANLTLEMLRYQILKYIGSYAAAMNGLDLVVFTGGMGENDPVSREAISKNLAYLGVDFNCEINKGLKGKDVILTNPGSKVVVATVTTNEELVIAKETMALIKK